MTGESITSTLHLAAKELLPQQKATARKPWISNKTFELIDRRNDLRIAGKHREEIELQREIKKSVKHDRRNYLEELVGAGMWSQLKLLRRGSPKMKGRLRNAAGVVVENDEKAETLADYFENIQWRVRLLLDVGVAERLGPLLEVS